jgi:hypothetical protein
VCNNGFFATFLEGNGPEAAALLAGAGLNSEPMVQSPMWTIG